jgi:tRNA nucleotidyltransferase (CCA-adding enzyme)
MKSVHPVAPPAVRWITRTLEEAGFETWTVGGAVRDALLGHPSGDWDLATRATPRAVRRIFRRTVPIGVEHGTVGVLARDGTMYEVTTFRRDVQTDGRHAVVAFADTIEEDLARRDFTVNAVAWHALREVFCDPYGGAADLEAGVLRTVGIAEDRFREDYLRILRALRFAGRFELRIEETTWQAACRLVGHLPVLSAERIREELIKVLGQDARPTRALELYADSGALAVLYPELEGLRPKGAWLPTLAVIERLPAYRSDLRLAALLRPLSRAQAAAVLLRLRLSNALTDETATIAAASTLPRPDAADVEFRRWLRRHGSERLGRIARVELAEARAAGHAGARGAEGRTGSSAADVVASWRRCRSVRRADPPLQVGDLRFGGADLKRLGLRPGPLFGRVLDGLLDWVLEDPRRNEPVSLEERAHELASELSGTDSSGGDGP